jgi:hypothetical protein
VDDGGVSTPSPRSSYVSGSVANMARSLLVVAGLVAVLIAVVPRVNTVSQPPVDVSAAAVEVAKDSGWAISRPEGLPEGWKATSVRHVRSTDGLMTWHAGYQSPSGNYVALEQTQDATRGWVEAQTNRARQTGELEAAGRTWAKYERTPKVQRSLVATDTSGDRLTTLVTGTGTFDELVSFAESLQPVETAEP